MVFQPRVVDPFDQGLLLQEAGHRERVLAVSLHAQRQGLEALEEEEAVEGAESGTRVA